MLFRAARRPFRRHHATGSGRAREWGGLTDHFRVAFENAPAGVALLAQDGSFARVNRALCELLGYRSDALTRLTLDDVTHEDHRELEDERRLEQRLVRADGTDVWVALTKELVRDGHGATVYVVAHLEDVTQRRETERALREAEERFRRAFEDSPIGMALVGIDGRFLRVNTTLCSITGFDEASLLRQTFQDITHPDDLDEDVGHAGEAVAGEIRTYGMEKRYLRPDGSVVWVKLTVTLVRDDDGTPLYFVSEVEDIGERKRTQVELQRLASFDALTALGNRRKLTADLEAALATSSSIEPCLLVIFDLNGFKQYNDSFGHPAGDTLLTRLARRLAEAAQPYGEAYRLGGDEFCVLGSPPVESGSAFIDATAKALEEEGAGFSVNASFGAAVLPEEAGTPSAALTIADRRLYTQKHLFQSERDRPHAVLLRALTEREPALSEHCSCVADLAVVVGARLGIEPRKLDELRRAAELHDIGKLAMPDGVLGKRGPLTPEEWELMHQHTLIGERILASSPALGGLGPIVRSTHERWDGTGYPDGLAGDAIPQGARIIAVCDAYMAMAADRPYQRARPARRALEELNGAAGTQFDPVVVAAVRAEVASGRRSTSRVPA